MATSINTGKEQATAARPCLLASFSFPDGAVLRVSTHNGTGGYTFGGNAYEPRIGDQEIERLASLSEQGVDRIPSVTVKLADPDAYLWTNYERAAGKGFKGARLELRFVLFDPLTGEYSTDSFIPFVGTCDKPGIDGQHLTVSAASKLNLTKFSLPTVPVQIRCAWVNPANDSAAALAEKDNPNSRFYPCGASLPCQYTKQTCTVPLRFSGVTWEPPAGGSGREYISGAKNTWHNADTSGKFRAYHPLWLGGVAWIDAVVLNQVADGNYTRGEVSVGVGEIEVERVIVNGVELSHSQSGQGDFRWHYVNQGARDGQPNGDHPYDGNGDPYGSLTVIQVLAPHSAIDPNSQMSVRVRGHRKKLRVYRRVVSAVGSGGNIVVTFDGPNQDCAGNPPFTVTIEGCSWAAVNGTHTLVSWAYGPPGTITLTTTGTGSGTGGTIFYEGTGSVVGTGGASTPWSLMEALKWSRFAYDELNVMAFADTAKTCNESISYTDQNGNTSSQSRFSTAVALTQRRSAAEVIRGLRQSIGALIVPGSDGKLALKLEGPLAEQQPAAVDGSNDNTPRASKLRNGSAANGYVAYAFNESNSWGLKTIPAPLDQMPNRVEFPFSDPTYEYAVSTYALIDSDDVARVDSEIPGGLQVQPEGIASHNHATRIAKLGEAKILRGNPHGDTRGTDWAEWQCSFRGCKLQIGQIVSQTNARLGYDDDLFRLTEIKPSRNFETVTLRGHLHNDNWYLDSIGNAGDPAYSSRGTHSRFPAPWQPNADAPTATGNPTYDVPGSLFDAGAYSFKLQPLYETDAEGNTIPRLQAWGATPVNQFSAISSPLVGRQGTTTSTGGTIPGVSGGVTVRRLYAVVCAKDSAGKLTRPSEPCFVDITAATNANAVTIPVTSWDANSAGYVIYAGWTLHGMTRQAEGAGKPASVTLTALTNGGKGVPDQAFERLVLKIKRIQHAGVFGAQLSGVSSGALTIAGAGWSTNQWAGYDCSVLAINADVSLPIANFHVNSNNGTTLFVSPDPFTFGSLISARCVLIMRSKPTVAGFTLTDANWANSLASPTGLNADEEKGRILHIVAGKGKGERYLIASNTSNSISIIGPWIAIPDATTRYIIEDANWLPEQGDSLPVSNGDPAATTVLTLPVSNYKGAQLLVAVYSRTADGIESIDSITPFREIYLPGQAPGIVEVTGDYTQTPDVRTVLARVLDGVHVGFAVQLLPSGQWHGRSVKVKKISDDPEGVTVVCGEGDVFEDGTTQYVLTAKDQYVELTAKAA